MSETYLTIQEAAAVSGKSIQTIRRALKGSRLQAKRKRTPQGFNYLISRDSLINFYKLKEDVMDREPAGLNNKQEKSISGEFATLQDLQNFQHQIEQLLDEQKKEKDSFIRFMKAFQERFVVMENQMKLLEQPKKRWFHFWK